MTAGECDSEDLPVPSRSALMVISLDPTVTQAVWVEEKACVCVLVVVVVVM